MPPQSVRVIRTLGQGRAARAQLVVATMEDGSELTCVEKVFAPGWLTRTIYRLSFQSPFAYQSNRDAILACFYRRKVAAAVLAASDLDAEIAKPLYVRFDQVAKSWVLAAQWIDGRGIKPAPADSSRIKRYFRTAAPQTNASTTHDAKSVDEVDELVALMHRLEAMLGECGLVGSGWQVAPRALVSSANLLRVGERYTVIDLESGIPAVLVPRYLWCGLRRATLPPFDDLDANLLRSWMAENQRLLTFRIGPNDAETLARDLEALINYSARWKAAEFAVLRRPWRHLTKAGNVAYQRECFRRWQQDGVVDEATALSLPGRPWKARAIWWSSILPSSFGRFASRLIGHREYRANALNLLRDTQAREAKWCRSIRRCHDRWIAEERLPETTRLTKTTLVAHRMAQSILPRGIHRFLVDPKRRRETLVTLLLFLFSPRYQSWFGGQRVAAAIDRWQESQRITEQEANELRQDLRGHEVLAYTRGFGMHLALKTVAPIIVPAKVGGVAAFLAGGSFWFLLPMLWTPVMRTLVTLFSAWTTRHQNVPHGETLATGWLPFVGSVAFPLQMFSTRPKLSTFLIRDAASKLARRVPVYGGADSRTELAMIRATDVLIAAMEVVTDRLPSRIRSSAVESEIEVIRLRPRTRLGRWLNRQATQRMRQPRNAKQGSHQPKRIAA